MYFLQIHFGLTSKAMYFSYIQYFTGKQNSISLDILLNHIKPDEYTLDIYVFLWNWFGYFTKVMYFPQIHFGLPSKAMYFSYILSYFRWKQKSISLDMNGYSLLWGGVFDIHVLSWCADVQEVLSDDFMSSSGVQMPSRGRLCWWPHIYVLSWCPDALALEVLSDHPTFMPSPDVLVFRWLFQEVLFWESLTKAIPDLLETLILWKINLKLPWFHC